MHKTYLCQAFMHLCVQQIADTFKFQYVISIVLVPECANQNGGVKILGFFDNVGSRQYCNNNNNVGLFINLKHCTFFLGLFINLKHCTFFLGLFINLKHCTFFLGLFINLKHCTFFLGLFINLKHCTFFLGLFIINLKHCTFFLGLFINLKHCTFFLGLFINLKHCTFFLDYLSILNIVHATQVNICFVFNSVRNRQH